MNSIQLLISCNGRDLERDLRSAAARGSEGIALLMIGRGAGGWNSALINAAEMGHIDVVEMIVQRGANQWNAALNDAAENGPIEVLRIGFLGCVRLLVDHDAEAFDVAQEPL